MPADALVRQVREGLSPRMPDRLGLAVSGGGDSLAMLHLFHEICRDSETRLHVVTVDHGLRDGSRGEAEAVARQSAALGLPHEILTWSGWDQRGNMQHEARNARLRLISDWAHRLDIDTVALAHTADDQAETMLMRLARRAGVDGLAGMAEKRIQNGVCWMRPLLGIRRSHLRDYLTARGVSWTDDPSNENLAFDRVKARKALGVLAELGIDADTLSEVARNMAIARDALNWTSFGVLRDLGKPFDGAAVMCARRLRAQPIEIQRRLLIHGLRWIRGSTYPPRRDALCELMKALRGASAATVDGCHALQHGGHVWIFREYQAVRDTVSPLGTLWDGRWRVGVTEPTALPSGALEIRALGPEGLLQCPDWRATAQPRAALLGTPAVWQGDTVIAAPVAGHGQNWYAEIDGGEDSFFTSILSH